MYFQDTYCWIHSTYSVPKAVIGKQGIDNAHAGVAPDSGDEDDQRHHKYYQWVCFVLFFQAAFFYFPR